MRRSGSQKGARPVPQAVVFTEGHGGYQCWQDCCYSLGCGLPPSPTPSTGYQMRASSPVLRGQWKPDSAEFPYLVSLRLHGIWCLRPTPTPCKQQWILRRNGPETHMALSFPLSRAVSNWMSLVGLALDASPASLPG